MNKVDAELNMVNKALAPPTALIHVVLQLENISNSTKDPLFCQSSVLAVGGDIGHKPDHVLWLADCN